jgi:hypothetical protein
MSSSTSALKRCAPGLLRLVASLCRSCFAGERMWDEQRGRGQRRLCSYQPWLDSPAEGDELLASEEGTDPEFGKIHMDAAYGQAGGDLSSGFSNDLAVYGHFSCTDGSADFELGVEFQLILSGGVEGGSYETDTRRAQRFQERRKHG